MKMKICFINCFTEIRDNGSRAFCFQVGRMLEGNQYSLATRLWFPKQKSRERLSRLLYTLIEKHHDILGVYAGCEGLELWIDFEYNKYSY